MIDRAAPDRLVLAWSRSSSWIALLAGVWVRFRRNERENLCIQTK